MTDIVDRLRDIDMSNGQQVTPFMMMTARKAADEIERLRRAEHSTLKLLRELTAVRVHYGDVVTELKAEIERLRALNQEGGS